jgi:hypothetical protein
MGGGRQVTVLANSDDGEPGGRHATTPACAC